MSALLDINHLSISFFTRAGEIPAVMDFSVSIQPGEVVGLVGESGCGKSTVALAVMRDLGKNGRIMGGTVRFDGRDMADLTARELRDMRGRDIAMIYQEPMASLNPAMKIGAQLAEVPILHEGLSREAAMQRAREMVVDVRLPDPDRVLNAYPHQLSGGQQQRIVIAMALMSQPKLLILDEPTTALDVTVEAAILRLLRNLGAKYGTAMMFISHNLGLVRESCDKICVMYSGEAVETGPVDQVFRDMRHPYTRALFDAIPLASADKTTRPLRAIAGNFPLPQDRPPGCSFGPRCDFFTQGQCDGAHPDMRTLADGDHETRCLRIDEITLDSAPRGQDMAQSAPGDVILSVEDLRKYYELPGKFGGTDTRVVKANESISFDLRAGETLAVVGESGCGKSTLAKVILGLETATSGRVALDGRDLAQTPIEARRTQDVADIQMVFQNPFDTLNPAQNIGGQIKRALEILATGQSRGTRESRMKALLDLVKLPRAFAKRMPRQLSGGQKQRVGIARAFAGDARIVVADEPVSALDVSVQAAVAELLLDIQAQKNTALLFISHDLSIVRYLSDRVMVMYLGHVVEIGTTAQVFQPPYHPYTEALLSAAPVPDPDLQKAEIILDGDVPSAITPPPGCPFQTRCRWKDRVEDHLCDRAVPPMRETKTGTRIKCHLSAHILAGMAPVIAAKRAPD